LTDRRLRFVSSAFRKIANGPNTARHVAVRKSLFGSMKNNEAVIKSLFGSMKNNETIIKSLFGSMKKQ
jgi:hypothetical protein